MYIFQNMLWRKVLARIYKKYLQINKKNRQPNRKVSKTFEKEKVLDVISHQGTGQLKQNHLLLKVIKMAEIKMIDSNKFWWKYGTSVAFQTSGRAEIYRATLENCSIY